MTKEEAEHAAEATFGPKAECIRVSSSDRNSRFVIALGSYRVSTGERAVPLLLGAGADWSRALDHARGTPNGKMAIEEMQKVKDFVNKAMTSSTPGEFTDFVKQAALDEAKARGANDAVLAAITNKFDEAKKKVIEKANDNGTSGASAGKED